MSRIHKALLALVVLILAAGAAATPELTRRSIRAALHQRCAVQFDAVCTADRIELAADGVFIAGLRFRSRRGLVSLLAQRVAIPVHWPGFLLRREQPLDLRSSEILVNVHGRPDELRAELRDRRGSARESTHRRFRVHRVDLQQVQIAASMIVGELPITASIQGAALLWTGEGTSLQWAEGRLTSSSATQIASGNCLLVNNAADGWIVDCGGFDLAAEVNEAVSLANAARSELQRASQAGIAAPAQPAMHLRPVAVTLRAHEGRLKVRNGSTTIVDASPAVVAVRADGTTIQEAELNLGRTAQDRPLVTLRYTQAASAWRVALEAESLPLQQLAPWIPGVPLHDTEHGIIRANVRISPSENRSIIRVDGSTEVRGLGLHHRMIARDPVDGLEVEARGAALLDLDRRRVASEGLELRVNGIPFSLAGWVERAHEHFALDAALRVPDVGCDAIRRSMPLSVTGPLDGFIFGGTIGADLHVAVDSDRPEQSALDLGVRDGCVVQHDNLTATLARYSGPFIQRIEEPDGVLRAFVTGPGAPAWVPLALISPLVVGAVVTREDGAFYRHHGFSPEEIRGAFVRNVVARRFAFGASTITMQLVKNILLEREKTLVRKLQEVVLTWWLEQSLTKDAILELYLNVVEFGPGIYGIGPASHFFFGREPHELTPLQSIYLATLLPAPIPRFANFERGAIGAETLTRLRHVARSMLLNHRMTDEEFAAASVENFAFRPRRSPVVGALTLGIDPNLTDADAARLVETIRPPGVRLSSDPPDGDGEGQPTNDRTPDPPGEE